MKGLPSSDPIIMFKFGTEILLSAPICHGVSGICLLSIDIHLHLLAQIMFLLIPLHTILTIESIEVYETMINAGTFLQNGKAPAQFNDI